METRLVNPLSIMSLVRFCFEIGFWSAVSNILGHVRRQGANGKLPDNTLWLTCRFPCGNETKDLPTGSKIQTGFMTRQSVPICFSRQTQRIRIIHGSRHGSSKLQSHSYSSERSQVTLKMYECPVWGLPHLNRI